MGLLLFSWKPLQVFLDIDKEPLETEEREALLSGGEPPKLWSGLGEGGGFQVPPAKRHALPGGGRESG